MAKIKIRPLDDRVVVESASAEETTSGGIVLPDSAQEKPQRGTVVAVGPGRLLESGERGDLSVTVGDVVIFGKYGGSDIEVNGEEVKILRKRYPGESHFVNFLFATLQLNLFQLRCPNFKT